MSTLSKTYTVSFSGISMQLGLVGNSVQLMGGPGSVGKTRGVCTIKPVSRGLPMMYPGFPDLSKASRGSTSWPVRGSTIVSGR